MWSKLSQVYNWSLYELSYEPTNEFMQTLKFDKFVYMYY